MKKNYFGIYLEETKISKSLSNEIINKITMPTKASEGEIPVPSRIINVIDSVLKILYPVPPHLNKRTV